MTENNKALVFQNGKVQRVEDSLRLTVGQGIAPANAAAELQMGATLEFDLVNGLPSHKVKNAELLVNKIAPGSAPSNLAGYGKFYALQDSGTSSTTLYFMDDAGTSHYLQNDGLSTVTATNGSVVLDLDPGLPPMRTMVTNEALDFSAINLQPGRSLSIHIVNQSAEDIDVTFPLNGDQQRWTWLGGTTPTAIPAGQESILSVVAFGTTNDDVVAAFSYDDSQQITGQGTPDYLAVFENERDIRSAFLYLHEEDNDGDEVNEVTRLGIGQGYGPDTDENNQPTGLVIPQVSLQVNSNKAASAEAILKLENNDEAFKFFALNASPEASVTGDVGDIASDALNGKLYFKQSGVDTTTGWAQIATSTKFFAVQGTLNANEACYFVDGSDNTVSQASAAASPANNYKAARVAGLVVRMNGVGQAEVQTSGVFAGAAFAANLTLSAGDPVFLSTTSGKLTNDVSGLAEDEVVAEVGVITSVSSNTEADVLIQPKTIVVL